MKESCKTCRFSTVTQAYGYTDSSRPYEDMYAYPALICRRFPQSSEVDPEYWCGEYQEVPNDLP